MNPVNFAAEQQKDSIARELVNYRFPSFSWDYKDRHFTEDSLYLFNKAFRNEIEKETSLNKKIKLITTHEIKEKPIIFQIINIASNLMVFFPGSCPDNKDISENMRLFNLFMHLGPDVNVHSNYPPIFEAIRKQSYLEVFKKLLAAGADYEGRVKVQEYPYNNDSLDLVEFAKRTYLEPKTLERIESGKKQVALAVAVAKDMGIKLRGKPTSFRDLASELEALMRYLAEHRAFKENHNILFSLACQDKDSVLSRLSTDIRLLILRLAAERLAS